MKHWGEESTKHGDELIKEYSKKLTSELRNGFSYIDKEYKITIGKNDIYKFFRHVRKI